MELSAIVSTRIANWRDGIKYERNRIDGLEKDIDDCRTEIAKVRNDIQVARGMIELNSEKCAEALNELEGKYGIIPNSDGFYALEGRWSSWNQRNKIMKLLDDVREGYDAMDENGGLNKEIKAYVRYLGENQDKIDAYEKIIRFHCKNIESYKKLIVENGGTVE